MHAYNTPYFHFCLSPDSKTEPRSTCLVSILSQQTLIHSQNCLYCKKWGPYKMRVAFPKPICVTKTRIGQPSANQDISTASYNSHHVTPPTSPAVTEHVCTHCVVWCQRKLTLGIKVTHMLVYLSMHGLCVGLLFHARVSVDWKCGFELALFQRFYLLWDKIWAGAWLVSTAAELKARE